VTADPWVQYLVVRKDHPLTLAGAMAIAGAGAVRCADRFRAHPRWADAYAAWEPRPRKVALRASPDELVELGGTLDAAPIATTLGETLLALPPRRRSAREPLLAALRPYTDPPRGSATAELEGDGPPLVYVVRPGVLRTAGKAMTQAGHAALLCVRELEPRHPEAFAAWRAGGLRGELREVDDAEWAALRQSPDAVVVADAGLTQVEPGTETVIALPPTA
jgi:peptidyl-tRNA hydrolase